MEIKHEHITEVEQNLINELLAVWHNKLTRNKIRQSYYDGKLNVKNLNIALPPTLASMSETTIGWGAKAVDALAVRSRFDGFVYKGLQDDPLEKIIRDNNFYDLYRQATISELVNSCSFITVSTGTDGEPDVILNAYPATQASATWNAREKRIDAGLVITKFSGEEIMPDSFVEPLAFILYTNKATFTCFDDSGTWQVRKDDHGYGRPLMEALVHNPSLSRPFGTSRISRAGMSIIDRALRTIVRADVAGEFATIPQKYLLGADPEILGGKDKWSTYIDAIFAVTKDENGDKPEYGQLTQIQFTPMIEQLRSITAEYSGEMDIPISELGVKDDNPASAEAIYAAKEALIMKAENLNITNGNALKNIGLLALAMLGGFNSIDDMPDEWKTIMPKFRPPARPSAVSQADAVIKQVTALPWLADTIVILEELGYTEDQIARIQSERTQSSAANTFLEIAGQLKNANTNSE